MKQFIQYFKVFHKEHFTWLSYGLSLAFILGLLALNFSIDLEDGIIDSYRNTPWHALGFILLHGIAFLGVMLILQLSGKKKSRFTARAWLKLGLGLVILSIDRSFYLHRELLFSLTGPETYVYTAKVAHNLIPLLVVVVPLFILKYLFDARHAEGLYGLRFRHINLKPYWIMLAGMVPLVYLASLMPEFIDYYPVYKRSQGDLFSEATGWPEAWTVAIFEGAYLMNFVFVELLFRGFFVIGLSRLLGGNVVLAMAATYCAYHFGKPVGEAVSSIFGGYILGVLALYSRNIYGGIFIHGGIALLMEIFAFYQLR